VLTTKLVHFEDAGAAFRCSSLQLGTVDLPKVLLEQKLSEKVAHARVYSEDGLVCGHLKGTPVVRGYHEIKSLTYAQIEWTALEPRASTTRTNCSSGCFSVLAGSQPWDHGVMQYCTFSKSLVGRAASSKLNGIFFIKRAMT
jgi:hypothetical protein